MAEPYAPILNRTKLVGGAEETTMGTDVLSSVTAAFSASTFYNIKCEPDLELETRQPHGHYLGTVDSLVGKRRGKLSMRQELRPSDTFLSLLTCAGFTGTPKAPTSLMSSRKTWTFKAWEKGRYKALYGAAANAKLVLASGKPAYCDWDIMGRWSAPVDGTMPAQSAINSQSYIVQGITLTIGAATIARVANAEIDLGNSVEEVEDVTATGGIAYFLVGERNIKVTLDTEARLIAENDSYGQFLAGTTAALSIVLTSGANTLTIACPRLQKVGISDEARGARLVDKLECQANASSGDDEITFTQA